jgi:RNA polymerase sigma-70 factor (ECF subfamily)
MLASFIFVLDSDFPLPHSVRESSFRVDFTSDLRRLTLPAAVDFAASASASTPDEAVVGLFDELREGLLRYLFSLGLATHDGEEIVQEAFLLLFQHLRNGKSRENLRGWVFRVARNLAFKLHRENQARLRQIVELDEGMNSRAFTNEANPEEQAWNRQRRVRLLAVVRALPEQDRECLFLRAEGLRYREIASVLGISLGSVAASMARVLARLGRADGS